MAHTSTLEQGSLRRTARGRRRDVSGRANYPEMETGASDSKLTMAAGIPSYGFSGMGIDDDDDRAHGKDERLRVAAFYPGVQFDYLYLKRLTGGK